MEGSGEGSFQKDHGAGSDQVALSLSFEGKVREDWGSSILDGEWSVWAHVLNEGLLSLLPQCSCLNTEATGASAPRNGQGSQAWD